MTMSNPPDVNHFLEELRSQENEPFGKTLHRLNAFSRSVNDFLSANTQQNAADKYLDSIDLTDFYARKTKLELANVLKRPGPIIDALKSEDKFLMHRALQFSWIYTDTSTFVHDPKFLIEELFPNISYSCRRKIINRMGRFCKTDDEKFNEIYKAVEQTYGIDLAKNLLPACGKSVIESTLSEKHVQLSPFQVRHIHKKFPELAIKYLNGVYEEILKANSKGWRSKQCVKNDSYYSTILKLLIKNNPGDFMKFFEKYSKVITDKKLGRRMTNHLLNHDTQTIIKSSKMYAKLLHQQQLMKRLKREEYEHFFINLFPENIGSFQTVFEIGVEGYNGFAGALHYWLTKFSLNDGFMHLNDAFQKAYQKILFDFPEYMTSRVIQLLPLEDRDRWIDFRLSHPDGQYLYQSTGDMIPIHREGYWEAFRAVDKSIPKIKDYLNTEADVHRRGDLLVSLVLTCAVNKDKSALAEICSYVASRFRNDSAQVRLEFLGALNHHFDLKKVGDEHWTAINELLQISSINNEFSHRSALMEHILEKSIQYRLTKDLPVDVQVQNFIKMKTRIYCRGESWCILTTEPTMEKKCLKLFINQLGLMYPLPTPYPSDSTITSAIISSCESISGWNRRHPKDHLSCVEFDWLITRLQEVFQSYHEPNKYRVITALGHDHQARSHFYPKLLTICPLPQVLNYFLRKEPQTLDESWTPILGFMLRSNNLEKWKYFFQKVRAQGFPKLFKKLVSKCLEIVEFEDESVKERCNAIIIMSFLIKSEKFLEWTSKYYPQDPKLDAYADDAGVTYEIRRVIAKCLKNIETPPLGLHALLHFCFGDYLKLPIGSLYSISYKSAVIKVIPFLNELVDRPISIKKHAIRLILTVSNQVDNIKFLHKLWESEKNFSIRHIIFKRIFELFLKDHLQTWNLLKSAITSLTVKDHSFISELGQPYYVTSACMPQSRLSEYLQLSWESVENLGDFGPDSMWVKVSLLQCITPANINSLEEPFLQTVFNKYLFVLKEDPNLQSNLVQVAVFYLLHYSKSCNTVDIIVKALERLTGPSWNSANKDSSIMYPAKQALSYFVEQLSIEAFKTPDDETKSEMQNRKQIFIKLQESLSSLLDTSEFFTDDLFLQFAKIFIPVKVDKDSQGFELIEIGKEVGKLVDKTIANYKPEIIGIFSETLRRFVSLCYKYRLIYQGGDGARIILIADGILNSTGSIDTQIVASHLLLTANSHLPRAHCLEDKINEILQKLRALDDKTIKIFLNYRLIQTRPAHGYDVLV